MSDNDIIRAKRLPDGTIVQLLPDGSTKPLEGQTDWARLEAMSEAEIDENARADSDNPPLGPSDLARMKSVPNPKQIRQRLHLTQEQFAQQFQVPLGTLRDWEQGTREPDSAARTLLRVIDRNPNAVLEALNHEVA